MVATRPACSISHLLFERRANQHLLSDKRAVCTKSGHEPLAWLFLPICIGKQQTRAHSSVAKAVGSPFWHIFESEVLSMLFSSRFKVIVVFSLLLVGVLSFALFNFPRVPVHAAYAAITLSVHAGPPTSSVTVQGGGFGPGETVAITFNSAPVGNAMTASTGSFSVQITVPASALPGSHIVQATGQSSGLSAQANFLVQTNWLMNGYNSRHTRFNPYENVLNVTNVSTLVQAWTATTGSSIYASPAVVNGIVYAGSSDTYMYAFDAKTGTTVWKAPGLWPIGASPAVADRIVYTGSGDGDLYAFNAKTGAVVWTALVGGNVDSPTVSQGIVYVGSSSGNTKLYALDAKAGTLIWTANTNYITSTPAVANNIVYVSSSDDNLYAFNAGTGASIWTAQTGGALDSSPTVVNGVVYVGSWDGKLYAFNAKTGTSIWTVQTGGPISFSSSAVANGTVYIGSSDHKLYAFDARTGKELWTALTGDQIWSSPTVANGVIYVGSQDDKLYAFNATTGAQLWTGSTGNQIFSSPTVVNGVVYVGSEDGKLYAFHIPGMLF